MLSDNHKNSDCPFAEQIISYLYDEFELDKKIEFEGHLENCRLCAADFAGFGLVRSSILEWRDADFSNLPTPIFAVPTSEAAKQQVAISAQPVSWIEKIKLVLAFNPTLAATALVIAFVGIGIALFINNFSNTNQIANNDAEKDVAQATISPTIEKAIKPETNSTPDKNAEKITSTPETADIGQNPKPKKVQTPEKLAVKVSADSPKNSQNVPVVVPKEQGEKKTLPVRKQRVPNLQEIDEDKDESIRLADLFDELDTK